MFLFNIGGTQSPPTLPYRCLTLLAGFPLIKVQKVFLILTALSQEQQLIIVFTVNPLTVVTEIGTKRVRFSVRGIIVRPGLDAELFVSRT